jgi:hypothetical protein
MGQRPLHVLVGGMAKAMCVQVVSQCSFRQGKLLQQSLAAAFNGFKFFGVHQKGMVAKRGVTTI